MLSRQFIENYFLAEKQTGILFMAIGLLGIVVAIVLMCVYKTSFMRGMAVPLIVVGSIQAVVGFTVYRKSDNQRSDMVYAFDMDPAKLRNEELPRMMKVVRSFKPIIIAELVLVVAGIFLVFCFRNSDSGLFWYGLGLALVVEAMISVVVDFVAEKRAIHYLGALQSFFNI